MKQKIVIAGELASGILMLLAGLADSEGKVLWFVGSGGMFLSAILELHTYYKIRGL